MERRTKIIATLGPAVDSAVQVDRLVGAGMDAARLNFSHGTRDEHRRRVEWVRRAAQRHRRGVMVLQDIQGPRIRTGTFPGGGVELVEGDRVLLVEGDGEGSAGRIFVQHLGAVPLLPGARVLFADGLVAAEVDEVAPGEVRALVRQGGRVADRKSVAFPGRRIALPAVTDKDSADLAFAMELGIDAVAASFVESAADIAAVRGVVGELPVVAKIERAAAVEGLAGILGAADGVMVARGDLGVELGYEPLPRVQRRIIAAAIAAGRISITATEMLESMVSAPRPTRAEVSDVAAAVMDGSDALMLSAETAVGRHPIAAVEAMAAIIREAEAAPDARVVPEPTERTPAAAIAAAAVQAAETLGVGVLVAFTETGRTARLISQRRPWADIVAFTPHPDTRRRMALLWGVIPREFPECSSTDEMFETAEAMLLRDGLVGPGDRLVMAAGIPPGRAASTNLLKIHLVGG